MNRWSVRTLKRLRWWRFKLFQVRRYDSLVLEKIEGKPFVILPKVFHPGFFFTSRFFVTCFSEKNISGSDYVLDLGTGSGILAIFAADFCKRVVATDISPYAVRCAQINVLLNGLEDKIEVRRGNLFEPVKGEKFDLILYSPPFYPGEPKDWLDYAWRCGEDHRVIFEFVGEVRTYLNGDGRILMVSSTEAPLATILGKFEQEGFTWAQVARKNLLSEILYVYEIRPK